MIHYRLYAGRNLNPGAKELGISATLLRCLIVAVQGNCVM